MPRLAIALVAFLVLAAVLFVAGSLRRPMPPTRAPDPPRPVQLGDTLAGPVVTTVDATSDRTWTRFDFARSSVVAGNDPDWDLAFRRHHVIVNGGEGFSAGAGIVDLGDVPFEQVREAPAGGYLANRVRSDTTNPAIERWYRYSFTSHLLTAGPNVYAVRTADGRYATLQILSYYCPGAQPGCVTFRWVYQGDGSRRFTPQSTWKAGTGGATESRAR